MGQAAVGERDTDSGSPGYRGEVYGPPDPEVYGPPDPPESEQYTPSGSPDSMGEMRYSRQAEPEENETTYRPAPDSFDEIVRRSRDSGTDDGQGIYDRPWGRFPSIDTVNRPGRTYPSLDDDEAYRGRRSSLDAQDSDDADNDADSRVSDRTERDDDMNSSVAADDDDAAPDRAPTSIDSDEPSSDDPPAEADDATSDEPSYFVPADSDGDSTQGEHAG